MLGTEQYPLCCGDVETPWQLYDVPSSIVVLDRKHKRAHACNLLPLGRPKSCASTGGSKHKVLEVIRVWGDGSNAVVVDANDKGISVKGLDTGALSPGCASCVGPTDMDERTGEEPQNRANCGLNQGE